MTAFATEHRSAAAWRQVRAELAPGWCLALAMVQSGLALSHFAHPDGETAAQAAATTVVLAGAAAGAALAIHRGWITGIAVARTVATLALLAPLAETLQLHLTGDPRDAIHLAFVLFVATLGVLARSTLIVCCLLSLAGVGSVWATAGDSTGWADATALVAQVGALSLLAHVLIERALVRLVDSRVKEGSTGRREANPARPATSAPAPAPRHESRMQHLADATLEGIIVHRTGRITEANAAAASLLGRPREDLVGSTLGDFVKRFDDFVSSAEDDRRGPGGSAFGRTWQGFVMREDGSTTPVDVAVRTVPIDGEMLSVTLLRDITEQVRAESALRQRLAMDELITSISSEFLGLPAEQADQAVVRALAGIATFIGGDRASLSVFDEDQATMRCTHEWVSPGLATVQGLVIDGSDPADRWWMQHMRRIEPICLANVADEIPPQSGNAGQWLIDRGMRSLLAVPIVQHGRVRGTVTCTSAGSLRSVGSDAIALLRIVGELCFGALSHARAQHALQASEARKAAILESALDCIVSMDARGRVTEFNPAAEKAFGWSREEAIGRDLAELMIPLAVREAHTSGLRRFLESGATNVIGHRIEVSAMRRDGGEFPVELAVVATVIDEETIFTAYLRDITQRREMERLRDELVATVSHELRTPLTSLRGFTELLMKRDFPLDRKRKFLAVIHNETIRLTKLVNDFLDLKRLESGAEKLRTERFDVVTLLEDTVTLFRRDDLPHVFELEIGDDLTFVRGDPDRTRQILANLVSNAVKFSPDGGRVTIDARRDGNCVVVSVRDHGIGMNEQTIASLFRKFFRADNAETRSIGGTGLGLALVKEMVEQQGGRVSVTSAPGAGSTFSFTLPVAGSNADEKPDLDPDDLSYARPVRSH